MKAGWPVYMKKRRLRIAFLLPAVVNRGPVIFTHYLLMGLKEQEQVLQAEVFYFKGRVEYDLGVQCTKISWHRPYDFSKFDIVHTTMGVPDIYASIFCRNEVWVTSMHNYIEQDIKMVHSKIRSLFIIYLWKQALFKAQNVIVSSDQMKRYYEAYIGRSKFYKVIPYGINEKKYESIDKRDIHVIRAFKNKGYTIIGSVGLMIRRKGFHQIIDLLQMHNDCAAVIVGDGPELENLIRLSTKTGVRDRIFFPGFKNQSFHYYQYIDIYAHVSYSEGFGLALLEAMSKKKPVICSRLEIYKDYFTENDVAYFDTDNMESLSRAYCKVKCNMKKYAEASYRLFKNIFSLEKMAKDHINYYFSILESRSEDKSWN